MKKILLFSTLVFAGSSFAQLHLNQTRFGLTAGANYSRVANAHNPSGARYTFQGGVLAMIPMGKTNQFFIQPELLYYGAGETGKDKNAKGKDGYDAVYANNYLSVPIYFKGYFSESESEFFGLIGPRFNFLVNQNVRNTPAGRSYYNPDITDPEQPAGVNGKANNINWGLGLGVGYSFKRQVELALRYDLGFSDTYPGLVNEIGGNDSKKSEQVIAVTLNYIFK